RASRQPGPGARVSDDAVAHGDLFAVEGGTPLAGPAVEDAGGAGEGEHGAGGADGERAGDRDQERGGGREGSPGARTSGQQPRGEIGMGASHRGDRGRATLGRGG